MNKNKGSLVLTGNYTAWVVSLIVAKNFQKIRLSIIFYLEVWAKSSVAIFNSQKTVFTHFLPTL